jgi:hypothetical protein
MPERGVEQLARGIGMREVAAHLERLAQRGVQALDRVGRVQERPHGHRIEQRRGDTATALSGRSPGGAAPPSARMPVKAMLAALRRNHPPTGKLSLSSQTSDHRIQKAAQPSEIVFQPCERLLPHSDEFFQGSAKSIHPSERSCQRPQESCRPSPMSRQPSPGLCPLYQNRGTNRLRPVTLHLRPVTFA